MQELWQLQGQQGGQEDFCSVLSLSPWLLCQDMQGERKSNTGGSVQISGQKMEMRQEMQSTEIHGKIRYKQHGYN